MRSPFLTLALGLLLIFNSEGYAQKNSVVEGLDSLSEKISLDLKDVEIKDALRLVSKISGLNIVVSDEVKGTITARLQEVNLDEALSAILRACGLGYVREGNIIRIIKIEPEVLGIDFKTPQVSIQSKVVEAILDKNNEMGINWEKLQAKYESDYRLDFRTEGSTNFPLGQSGLLLNFFSHDVDALLQMLNTEVKTNVLSSPKVVSLDNKEAKILVGDKVAYQQSFGQSAAGITTTSVLFEDVGIKLIVTPYVRAKDYVILKIHSEVSTLKEWRRLSNGDEVPIIGTRQTDTQVIVKDKSTLVIGGLINEEKRRTVYKVPILGDIPLLNLLFKYQHDNTVKKELLIFITPTILTVEENR